MSLQSLYRVTAHITDNRTMTTTERNTNAATSPTSRPPTTRSRLTNGADLLPSVDQRSTWARMFRDMTESMADHCGGADRLSEPERMVCRRIAAMEVELVHLEAKFAKQRANGADPATNDIDLYSRLGNTQRRMLETVGMSRRPRDVTPQLQDYLSSKVESVA